MRWGMFCVRLPMEQQHSRLRREILISISAWMIRVGRSTAACCWMPQWRPQSDCAWIGAQSLFTGNNVNIDGIFHNCYTTYFFVYSSDGWDRTAQICSLTQIILDPFYRTIKGFATLIEKEWCSFGYKFQDRCGHAEASTKLADERSPVFIQFLDALYQLLLQAPSAFEYTEDLLVFVGDHLHSGLFGNFLGNCEKNRVEVLNVRRSTKSIWNYVLQNHGRFANSRYTYYDKPIWPRLMLRDIRLWERFFCRWDTNSHPHHITGLEWHDDW